MKKIFIILFMVIIYASCSGQSLRMIYTTPTEYDVQDVEYVLLFVYEQDTIPAVLGELIGTDSVGVVDKEDILYASGFDSLIAVPYTKGVYYYEHRHFFDPKKIISVAAQAVDIRTRRSRAVFVPFLDKPSDAIKIKLGK